MAAIEGFDLSLGSDKVNVSAGMVNGVAKAATTGLTPTGDAIQTLLVVVKANGDIALRTLAAREASDVVLGSCTADADNKATAVSFAHRGSDKPASA